MDDHSVQDASRLQLPNEVLMHALKVASGVSVEPGPFLSAFQISYTVVHAECVRAYIMAKSAAETKSTTNGPTGQWAVPFKPSGMPSTRFGTPLQLDNGEENYGSCLDWTNIVNNEPDKVADWLRFLIARDRKETVLPLFDLYKSLRGDSEAEKMSAEYHPNWHAFASSGLPLVLMELASDPDIYVPSSDERHDDGTSVSQGYKVLKLTLSAFLIARADVLAQDLDTAMLTLISLKCCLSTLLVTDAYDTLVDDLLSASGRFCQTLWSQRKLLPRSPRYPEVSQGYSDDDMAGFYADAVPCVTGLVKLYHIRR